MQEDDGSDDEMRGCFRVTDTKTTTWNDAVIKCTIGGVAVEMLIDSGSAVNVITKLDWQRLIDQKAACWNRSDDPKDTLKPYAAETPLTIRQSFVSTIEVPRKERIAKFYVVEQGDVSLLSRSTAIALGVLKMGLNINQVKKVEPFPKIKNIKVRLFINAEVRPVIQPLRRVPISVEPAIEKKLQEAMDQDIIEKVREPSEWISPILVLFKKSGEIRICVDMRRANLAIARENFPLPTFEALMAKLRGAKFFTRLDLVSAYHQMELHEDSRKITTFITHIGVFRYKRLMFGVNAAPEIFQREYQSILAGLFNCINFLDDTLIYGKDEKEHDECLAAVEERLRENNVALNEDKCERKVQELEFLGHTVSCRGINADDRKVEAIRSFRAPANKEELRSFLGLVTYLGKFIPDVGTLTDPLRQLTKEDVAFKLV